MNPVTLPLTDPVGIFAVIITAVFLAPLIAVKIGLPPIIGLLFSGIIIGPNASGLITHDRGVDMIASIGLIYLMFTAGIEIDLVQFTRKKRYSALFGALTFAIPIIAGTAVSIYFLGLSPAPAALLASMISSHTLVTYPEVSIMGLTKRISVVTAVGGTIITNMLAMFILAVVTGSHSSEITLLFFMKISLMSILFSAGVLWFVPFIGRKFFSTLNMDGITEYTFVLSVLFICSWLSYVTGLEPIIGAFLAGIALNRLIPEMSTLMNRIRFAGNSIFIPVFLISVGMLFNPSILFTSDRALIFSGVMIITAIAAKGAAAIISGRILKFSSDDTMLIFGLTVNQAAATLAAVIVGYRLGIFDDAVVTGTISMILATCFAGSWFTSKAVKKILESMDIDFSEIGSKPPQRIMVTVSNSSTANELMNLAFMIREKGSEEPVYPINIVNTTDPPEESIARSERVLAPAVIQAISAGVPVMPVTRSDMNIISGIDKASVDLRASHIITGWSGNTPILSAVAGELPEKIVKQTAKMIFVCRLRSRLNITLRLLILLPHNSARHRGFKNLMNSLLDLASQLRAELLLFIAEDNGGQVQEIIKSRGFRYPWREFRSPDMKLLIEEARKEIRSNDLVIFHCFRESDPGWTPTLHRMPGKAARIFSSNSFIAAYPSKHFSEPDSGLPESARENYPQINFTECTFPDKSDLFQSVSSIIDGAYDNIYSGAIIKKITAALADEPVELMEGLILLHCHTSYAEKPGVYTGSCRGFFSGTPAAMKIKGLVILIAPRDQSPEIHLDMLAAIVRSVRSPEFMERVMGIKSVE